MAFIRPKIFVISDMAKNDTILLPQQRREGMSGPVTVQFGP